MGWFRLDDRAHDHPKLLALSDGAFRLWTEAGAYCSRHLTDGVIHRSALSGFRSMSPARAKELIKVALWEQVPDGFFMHDYLVWNDSKRDVEANREAARLRQKAWRARRRNGVTHPSRNAVTNGVTNGEVTSGYVRTYVPDPSVQRNLEEESEEKPVAQVPSDPFLDPRVTDRAGRFLERYTALYTQHRRGARYLVHPRRDYDAAVRICATWTDDVRLDKLATIFLTTNHAFAAEGSRTINQFAALASWCDGQLAEWEARQESV